MKNSKAKVKLINYIGTTLSLISSVCTILTFCGVAASFSLFKLIVGIVFLFLTVIVFLLRDVISKRIMVYLLNKTVPNSNVVILDKIVTYEHVERHKYNFVSSYRIKVIGEESINSFPDMVKWTAGPITEVSAIQANQTIEYDESFTTSSMIEKQRFTIKFPNGKKISKNDEPYRSGFKVSNLEDIQHKAKSILSVGIYDVTKGLVLKVYFEQHLHPQEIRGLKYAHFIDKIPYDTEPLKLETDRESSRQYVEFIIPTPIYGGKYEVDWNFSD